MSKELKHIDHIYFLGIGGIGMSALARYFLAVGKQVAGYDLTSTPLTESLSQLGAKIHYTDDPAQISGAFLDPEHTWVVRTPAVPVDHAELNFFQSGGFTIYKRAEILGMIFNEGRGIAIAGTHGKTSVSAMTAGILSHSSAGCNAFLGGLLKNSKSNLILNEQSKIIVAEADEFDRSFLRLFPEIALITWVDADHLDIYGNAGEIQKAFAAFAAQVKEGGTLILKQGIELPMDRPDVQFKSYALDDTSADFYARDITIRDNRYRFNIRLPDGTAKDIAMQVPGKTNIENAVAAAALASTAGASAEEISRGLNAFPGVVRRFDIQVENEWKVYIDDYAHHPRELDAVISSVRELYRGRKITGVFQPHLYSRTRDFAAEFGSSLSQLDELLLMDIYPAREKPVPGIDANIILKEVSGIKKELCPKEKLMEVLSGKELDVLLTLGAGDIDRFVEPIRKLVEQR